MDPLYSSAFAGVSDLEAAALPAFHVQRQQPIVSRGAFQPPHDANQLIPFQPPTCNANVVFLHASGYSQTSPPIHGALQRDAAGPPSCALEPRDDAVQRIKQSTLQKNYSSGVSASSSAAGDSTNQSLLMMENRQSATEIRLQLTQIMGKLDRIVERVESPASVRRPATAYSAVTRYDSCQVSLDELSTYNSITKLIQDTQRMNFQLDKRIIQVETVLENMTGLLAENKRHLENLNEKSSEHGQGLSSVYDDVHQMQVNKLTELELDKVRQEVRALRDELNSKEKTNVDLIRQLENAHSSNIITRTELSTYKDRVNEHEAAVERLRCELRDERQSRIKHENNIAHLVADFEEIQAKKESLEKTLTDVKAKTNKELSSRDEELRAINDKHEKEILQLRETIRQERRRFEMDLAQKAQQLEEEMNRVWEERHSRYVTRIDTKHANELKELADDNARLGTKIEALEQKLTAAKVRDQLQAKQLEELSDSVQLMSKWESKYKSLRLKAMEMKERYEERIRESDENVTRLEQQLNIATKEHAAVVERFEKQLNEMSASHEERVQQLSNELQSSWWRLAELESVVSYHQVTDGLDVVDQSFTNHEVSRVQLTAPPVFDSGEMLRENSSSERSLTAATSATEHSEVVTQSDTSISNSHRSVPELLVNDGSIRFVNINLSFKDESDDDDEYKTVTEGSSTVDGTDDEFDSTDLDNDYIVPLMDTAYHMLSQTSGSHVMTSVEHDHTIDFGRGIVENAYECIGQPTDETEHCNQSLYYRLPDNDMIDTIDEDVKPHSNNNALTKQKLNREPCADEWESGGDDASELLTLVNEMQSSNFTKAADDSMTSSDQRDETSFSPDSIDEIDMKTRIGFANEDDMSARSQVTAVLSPRHQSATSADLSTAAEVHAGDEECSGDFQTVDWSDANRGPIFVTEANGRSEIQAAPSLDADNKQIDDATRTQSPLTQEIIHDVSTPASLLETEADENLFLRQPLPQPTTCVQDATKSVYVSVVPSHWSRDGCIISPPPVDEQITSVRENATDLDDCYGLKPSTTTDHVTSKQPACAKGSQAMTSIFDSDSNDEDDNSLFAAIDRARNFK